MRIPNAQMGILDQQENFKLMDITKALSILTTHVEKHSNNKYQASIMDSEKALQQPIFTVLTANKYMVRYLAKSGEKTANIEDLLKACHFILFEIQNRLNNENPN